MASDRMAARGLVLLLALALGAGGAAASERPAPLAVGERAPDIALRDQHGRAVRLSELLDRHDFVVVAFYVKAFTGG